MTAALRLQRKDDMDYPRGPVGTAYGMPIVETKDDDKTSEVYNAEAEQQALAILIEQRYRNMLKAMHKLIGDAFDLREDFRLRDEDTEKLLQIAAEQVVRIDSATVDAIREQLELGQRLGLSTFEIAHGVPAIGYHGIEGLYSETWAGRADTIARNELAEAQYHSALNRYGATGLVDRVKAFDGDQDGPCAAQNGRTFPLDDPPKRQHINCTLVISPLLREGVV